MAPKGKAAEETRLEILLAPAVLGISVSEACRLNGVTRSWFYRWLARYEREGILGLSERSRRPFNSPRQIRESTELAICAMRVKHPDWGPRRIRAEMFRAGGSPPAKSTIQRVLERNGLVSPQPRKRRNYIRFERPCPNDLWQIDARKHEFPDKTIAWIFNVLDDHARFLLASRASFALDGEAAWDAFEQGSCDHGCPREVLTDNGVYFSGEHRDFVAEFERRLWELGVKTIASTPEHPQTLGKVERFNKTQRQWVEGLQEPPKTLTQLQRRLDSFRWHYNHERPNQGIADLTPAERYSATPPASPQQGEVSRSAHRKANENGVVRYSGWRISLGREWASANVEVIEAAGKIRVIYGGELIRAISAEHPKGFVGTGMGHGGRRPVVRRMEHI